jgi:hypothetical protein
MEVAKAWLDFLKAGLLTTLHRLRDGCVGCRPEQGLTHVDAWASIDLRAHVGPCR